MSISAITQAPAAPAIEGGRANVAVLQGSVVITDLPIEGAVANTAKQVSEVAKIVIDPKVTPDLPKDSSQYAALRRVIREGAPSVYLRDENGDTSKESLKILGCGGCKAAYEISVGRALLLPNMSADSLVAIAARWGRIVSEEVEMSQCLTKLGLLSPLSQQVSVKITESLGDLMPAYLSETFETLSSRGLYIIDIKNKESSTWKKGEHYLFQTDEERSSEEKWDLVFGSLVRDVATIFANDIPTNGDSVNIAVVKKDPDSDISEHEVRYFGFDFSHKGLPIWIPDLKYKRSTPPHKERVYNIFNKIIEFIFLYEFGERFHSNHPDERALTQFAKQLANKYSDKVLAEFNRA